MRFETRFRLRFEPVVQYIRNFCDEYISKCRDAECLENDIIAESLANNEYLPNGMKISEVRARNAKEHALEAKANAEIEADRAYRDLYQDLRNVDRKAVFLSGVIRH